MKQEDRVVRAKVIVQAAVLGLDGMTRGIVETLHTCAVALDECGIHAMVRAKQTLSEEERVEAEAGMNGPLLKLIGLAADFVDAAREVDVWVKGQKEEKEYTVLSEVLGDPNQAHKAFELRMHRCEDSECPIERLVARFDAEMAVDPRPAPVKP